MTEFASQTNHVRELTDEELRIGFANCSGYGMPLNSLNMNSVLRLAEQKTTSADAKLLEKITETNTLLASMMQAVQAVNIAQQEQIKGLLNKHTEQQTLIDALQSTSSSQQSQITYHQEVIDYQNEFISGQQDQINKIVNEQCDCTHLQNQIDTLSEQVNNDTDSSDSDDDDDGEFVPPTGEIG